MNTKQKEKPLEGKDKTIEGSAEVVETEAQPLSLVDDEPTPPAANLPATANPSPIQVMQQAKDMGLSAEEMREMLAVQKDWEKNEASKAYFKAIAKFRELCPVIPETRSVAYEHNSGGGSTNYSFAGLAESIQIIKPAMAECGLSHSWRIDTKDGIITVTCVLSHSAGHTEETSLPGAPDASGKKNAIQAVKSTVSYLERITLFALLGLASQKDDTDGNVAPAAQEPEEKITEDQAASLYDLLTEVGGNKEVFSKWLKKNTGVDKIDDIPVSYYEKVEKALEKQRKS